VFAVFVCSSPEQSQPPKEQTMSDVNAQPKPCDLTEEDLDVVTGGSLSYESIKFEYKTQKDDGTL
jgi:hypothetical protein